MRTVLLKDPEMRERITRPAPPEAEGPMTDEEANFGAAPEPDLLTPDAQTPPINRTGPSATGGPRPYLAEPR